MVDQQIVFVLNAAQSWTTAFDMRSIMLYYMPPTWTVERLVFTWNTELSDYDKLMASQAYPGRWTPPPPQPDPRIALNAAVLANLRAKC